VRARRWLRTLGANLKTSQSITAASLALIASAVFAQPEVASFRDGRFSAILAFTDKADDFLSQWNRPAQPGYRPHLESTRKVSLGRPITGFVFFGNCPTATTGRCMLKADLVVSKLGGGTVEQKTDVPVWTQEQAPPENAVVLGEARFALKFERPDEVGRYRIEVRLREESSGKSGTLAWLLEVTE
jgi:hypothetical protein